jgi:hypothetical protein
MSLVPVNQTSGPANSLTAGLPGETPSHTMVLRSLQILARMPSLFVRVTSGYSQFPLLRSLLGRSDSRLPIVFYSVDLTPICPSFYYSRLYCALLTSIAVARQCPKHGIYHCRSHVYTARFWLIIGPGPVLDPNAESPSCPAIPEVLLSMAQSECVSALFEFGLLVTLVDIPDYKKRYIRVCPFSTHIKPHNRTSPMSFQRGMS